MHVCETMPEGPEIHRAADRLRKALVGKTLVEVHAEHPAIAGRLEGWVGREVESVEARSKAMLIRVGDHVLYSHNQLYGRWTVNRAATPPPDWNRSLRVSLINGTHACRLWSASDVMLLEPWEVEGHPYIAQLGPDIADLLTTPEEVRVHLDEARFQRRGLAGLLLDQRFLAGVGNYLRSEILFEAGVDPSRRLGHLNAAEKDALAEAAMIITRRAYHQKGVTVDLATYQTMRDNGVARRSARHYVFHRDGMACHRCQATIVHGRVGGRRLDVCPACQT